MNRSTRFCNAVLISAALVVPTSFTAHAWARGQDSEKEARQDKERAEKEEKAAKAEKKLRVYDAKHKDYHDWSDEEDRAYRRYLDDRHEEYRDFQKLNEDQRQEYWDWRHTHPDLDPDRH